MDGRDCSNDTLLRRVLKRILILPLSSILTYPMFGLDITEAADVIDGVRTIEIIMDSLEFDPDSIIVNSGETVRFVMRNRDKIAHDFTIGTLAAQQARRSFIRVLQDASEFNQNDKTSRMHDHPNAIIISPGSTKELVWTFNKRQRIEFGCNIPLHYEGGMRGQFDFKETVVAGVDDKVTVHADDGRFAPDPLLTPNSKEPSSRPPQGAAETHRVRTISVCFRPKVARVVDPACYDLTLGEITNLLEF